MKAWRIGDETNAEETVKTDFYSGSEGGGSESKRKKSILGSISISNFKR